MRKNKYYIMTHKDKMKWLKENDPMTYYEMTSDPTGGGGDDLGEGCLVLIVILGFIFLFSILFTLSL